MEFMTSSLNIKKDDFTTFFIIFFVFCVQEFSLRESIYEHHPLKKNVLNKLKSMNCKSNYVIRKLKKNEENTKETMERRKKQEC